MAAATEEEIDALMGDSGAPAAPAPAPALTPGRALQRRSRAIYLRPRKLSNDRMVRVLTAMTDMPVAADACKMSGISTSTLKYWLGKSQEGQPGDGFDVILDPDEPDQVVRLHEAWNDAVAAGLGRVERAAITRALGYLEPLTYQGRVIYKHDRELVALFGGESVDTYLIDKDTGQPVPESVMKQDPDLLQFILKTRLADVYGNRQTVDINHRGGVLVVSAVARTSEALLTDAADYKADAMDAEFSEIDPSDPTSDQT